MRNSHNAKSRGKGIQEENTAQNTRKRSESITNGSQGNSSEF
jgi:hypothetical protein